jgi:excisionase family DNA binding protein
LNGDPSNSDILLQVERLSSHIQRLEYMIEEKITPEYMTVKETADYLRVSVRTVQRLIEQGNLFPFRITDGPKSKLILSRRDVNNYLRGTG